MDSSSRPVEIFNFLSDEDCESLIEYYKKSNLFKVVNGEAGISEINSEISGLIDTIKG